jgi:trimethylamine monooxygenase
LKDCHEEINFQTDFVMELVKESGYKYDIDVGDIFHSWEHDKDKDILTYRDMSFASKFTKTQSPIHHSTFMTALDDSMACFLASK